MSKDVFDFLAANRPFYVATIDGGVPRVRPMGLVLWHEGSVWLGMGDHKSVYKQIVANPQVEVVATNSDMQWIRVSAKLVFDERPELFELALEAMPELKDIYPKGGPRMAIGRLADGEARFNDIAGKTLKTVKL